tara:strand:+ start:532 stop:981 length:450 start_codon:yes stop_codon:yes gene_type:complete
MIRTNKMGLKLLGKNQEDLKVISAYLQDSIVILGDMVFLKKNKTFVMIVNRFMWEDVEKGILRQGKRIRCAVKFEEVLQVKSRNINQKNKKRSLEYLAIKCGLNTDETYDIKIFFAGNSIITIMSESIEVFLQDIGKPWHVKHVPLHKI